MSKPLKKKVTAETSGIKSNAKSKSAISPTGTDTSTSTKKVNVPVILTSYDIFTKCIKRAKNLVNFHKESKDETGMEEHYCDAYRAAIVLSISALDAFIRTLVIEKIKNTLLQSGQQLSGSLKDYLKNLLNQDKLLDAARNYNLLEVVEKALREDFEKKSFQGEWKITYYMELAGHPEIIKQVSIKAELNETTLTTKLNKFTKRRHTIAHSGDYELNQTIQKENEIDKQYATDCIDIVSKFAKNLNDICETK
ncbi:MAG: HEPN domain-containing protein [Ferruginibacter sp.]